MPCKERDAFHQGMREYLNSLWPRDVTSERGGKTISKYRGHIEEMGKLLGNPMPRTVTLEQMQRLERQQLYAKTDRTLSQKCAVLRAFLRYCGNRDAMRKLYPSPSGQQKNVRERYLTTDLFSQE